MDKNSSNIRNEQKPSERSRKGEARVVSYGGDAERRQLVIKSEVLILEKILRIKRK
jgi:hypothetical protein